MCGATERARHTLHVVVVSIWCQLAALTDIRSCFNENRGATFRRQLRRALDFMQVARQWDIVRIVSTDSARNMIAASRQLPFEHICLELHIAPTIHHSGPFSFHQMSLLDSPPRLLSSRLSPAHRRCERRSRGGEPRREEGKQQAVREMRTPLL